MKNFSHVISMKLEPRDSARVEDVVEEAIALSLENNNATVTFMLHGVHVEVVSASFPDVVVAKWRRDRRQIELLGEQRLAYP